MNLKHKIPARNIYSLQCKNNTDFSYIATVTDIETSICETFSCQYFKSNQNRKKKFKSANQQIQLKKQLTEMYEHACR